MFLWVILCKHSDIFYDSCVKVKFSMSMILLSNKAKLPICHPCNVRKLFFYLFENETEGIFFN